MSRTEAQQRADARYMQDKKRITLDLTMETYETVKDIAERNGVSVMAVIRRSVDDLINKECCHTPYYTCNRCKSFVLVARGFGRCETLGTTHMPANGSCPNWEVRDNEKQ